jgi:hypothetical protein
MSTSTGQSAAARDPASATAAFTVTRGRPDPAELAAVMAVLLAAGSAVGAEPSAQPAPVSLWADRARMLTAPPRAAARSWRASTLPS